MSGETLLTRALSLSDELSQVSTDELKPFSGHIGRLSKFYRNLENEVEHDSIPGNDSSGGSPTPDEREKKANRHRSDLKALLCRSTSQITSINEAVWNFEQPTETDICLAARTVHIQNISTLQKRRFTIATASPERILILCACISLAKDFYLFELQGGWKPKQDIMVERIRNKQDPAVQQMGKNVQ